MRNLLLVIFVAVSSQAYAVEDDPCRDSHEQCGHDDGGDAIVTVDLAQDQNQTQDVVGGTQSVNLNQSYNSERVPPIFLYQANQVESCGRVFGFSGANTSGGWAFGVPIPRSWTPTCDLWKAANEAQENGFVWLSYAFQCSIKTVRRTMGNEQCQRVEIAAEAELTFAMSSLTGASFLPDLSGLYDQAAQFDPTDVLVGQVGEPRFEDHEGHEGHEEHLMADITQEEYEAQQETIRDQQALVERRQAQQQNLIEALEQERAADKVELDRLRRSEDIREAQRTQAVMDLLGLKSDVYAQRQEPDPPQEVEPADE